MSNDPDYKMVESYFGGYPVVELLHNGGPITEFDQNFKFGVKKAMLFLACMSVVKELALTPLGEIPDIEMRRTVVDKVTGTSILVQFFREFERPDGRRIEVPWVKLTSVRDPKVHIGFGQRKAKALWELRNEIANWADYPIEKL